MRKILLYGALFIVLILFAFSILTPNFIGAQDRASTRYSHRSREHFEMLSNPDSVQNGLDHLHKDAIETRYIDLNTENYAYIHENEFQDPLKSPLSTFSIDVDTASYSNTRRFIDENQLPPKDAVRIEELINYFPYHYSEPQSGQPFSITTNLTYSPWNPNNYLLRIGIKGKSLNLSQTPPANLVFLIDVSGSMDMPNKLPLIKRSLKLLVDHLKASDHVSIVVYAGSAGLVLPPTPGDQKSVILNALEQLHAGGSTAGGAGLELAYKVAKAYFIKGGNNRIILATDGDFNVGVSSDAEMERMIEEKRKEGVFLTVVGFGTGNLKDSKMEKIADRGNGQYAYIDSILEAHKIFVEEMGGTLVTIAKDVKLQLEFNPVKVKSYRLIGYENRRLASEDFEDDQKDAGELGAGSTVTALYELEPAGGGKMGQNLRYQDTQVKAFAKTTDELVSLKLRYKSPQSEKSNLVSVTIKEQIQPWEQTSQDLKFTISVAAFGMLLRQSKYIGTWGFGEVLKLAEKNKGLDKNGYREDFILLVKKAALIQQ